jgi:hypothetical protein
MGEAVPEPFPQEVYDFIEIILKLVHRVPQIEALGVRG